MNTKAAVSADAPVRAPAPGSADLSERVRTFGMACSVCVVLGFAAVLLSQLLPGLQRHALLLLLVGVGVGGATMLATRRAMPAPCRIAGGVLTVAASAFALFALYVIATFQDGVGEDPVGPQSWVSVLCGQDLDSRLHSTLEVGTLLLATDAGSFADDADWIECLGQTLKRERYPEFFARMHLVGDTWQTPDLGDRTVTIADFRSASESLSLRSDLRWLRKGFESIALLLKVR